MTPTTVKWRYHRKFRIQKTFRSKRQAMIYCWHIKRLWKIKPRMIERA